MISSVSSVKSKRALDAANRTRLLNSEEQYASANIECPQYYRDVRDIRLLAVRHSGFHLFRDPYFDL